MATSGVNGETGHQNRTTASEHLVGKQRTTKSRTSPRPASIGVPGKISTSTLIPRHHDANCATTRTVSPSQVHSIKPQSWSESNADHPTVNRVRIREKLRPVSANMTTRLRQQRERRRTKRREPYMPSTEGTSTGEETEELFHMDSLHNSNHTNAEDKARYRHSLQQQGQQTNKVPPTTVVSRRYSSPGRRHMSKSPSDLDADDEDNQDYDSASIISASEISQARNTIPHTWNPEEDAVFNVQFQEIRMAGMQQLAEIDVTAGPSVSDGTCGSNVEKQVGKLLENERREKSALIQELGQKEQRIYEMEKMMVDLNRRLMDYGLENEHLKAENRTLLQAMAKLSTGE